MTAARSSQSTVSLKNALTAGALGGFVADVINTLVYVVAQSFIGGPLIVEGEPLPLVAILLSSFTPGLAAGAVYWGLARYTGTPMRWFLILAASLLVLSFFGPLTQASGATLWALELMHLGAAAPIVGALSRLRS